MVDFRVEPGVVNIVLFVLFQIIALPLLESLLRTLVHSFYYRRMFQGEPIVLKDANFPGVTHCLVGRRTEGVNLGATATKVLMLAVAFVVESQLRSRRESVISQATRMASFYLNPSDEAWRLQVIRTVARQFDHSRECFIQKEDMLTYYQIGFQLMDGVILEDDFGKPGVNTSAQYSANDSTIRCLSPNSVRFPLQLVRVVSCSRAKPQGCTDQSPVIRPANILIRNEGGERFGQFSEFNFTDYDAASLSITFPEFRNFRFTCLTSYFGSTIDGIRRYRNCLLVDRNGTHTTVERWGIGRSSNGSFYFILTYPGPVFEGDIPFERYQSADLLRTLSIEEPMSWKDLSAQLVARSSEFVGNLSVDLGRDETITTIPLWAVIIGGCAATSVVISFVVLGIVTWRDERPKINTLKGLSSMLREEHTPSGNTLVQGEAAQIGISWFDGEKGVQSLGIVPTSE